jgi:hypothetical protein
MMYELIYFKKEEKSKPGLCGSDFNNSNHTILISLRFVVSISPPFMFKLPFTGDNVGEVSEVTMITGDKYYIRKEEYLNLRMQMQMVK